MDIVLASETPQKEQQQDRDLAELLFNTSSTQSSKNLYNTYTYSDENDDVLKILQSSPAGIPSTNNNSQQPSQKFKYGARKTSKESSKALAVEPLQVSRKLKTEVK